MPVSSNPFFGVNFAAGNAVDLWGACPVVSETGVDYTTAGGGGMGAAMTGSGERVVWDLNAVLASIPAVWPLAAHHAFALDSASGAQSIFGIMRNPSGTTSPGAIDRGAAYMVIDTAATARVQAVRNNNTVPTNGTRASTLHSLTGLRGASSGDYSVRIDVFMEWDAPNNSPKVWIGSGAVLADTAGAGASSAGPQLGTNPRMVCGNMPWAVGAPDIKSFQLGFWGSALWSDATHGAANRAAVLADPVAAYLTPLEVWRSYYNGE